MSIFINDLTITQFIFYTYFNIMSSLNYKIPKSLHYVRKGERASLKGETRFLEMKARVPAASRKELLWHRHRKGIEVTEYLGVSFGKSPCSLFNKLRTFSTHIAKHVQPSRRSGLATSLLYLDKISPLCYTEKNITFREKKWKPYFFPTTHPIITPALPCAPFGLPFWSCQTARKTRLR